MISVIFNGLSRVGFIQGQSLVTLRRPQSRAYSTKQRVILAGGIPLRPFSFRDLNLRQAEESLVAACLDHEHAIITAARELGVHPFCSEVAFELDRYYVTLINAYVRGAYSELNNRRTLALIYPDDAFRIETDLFDGNTAANEYVDALIAALRECYDAQIAYVAAAEALADAPISLSSTLQLSPVRQEMRRAPTTSTAFMR